MTGLRRTTRRRPARLRPATPVPTRDADEPMSGDRTARPPGDREVGPSAFLEVERRFSASPSGGPRRRRTRRRPATGGPGLVAAGPARRIVERRGLRRSTPDERTGRSTVLQWLRSLDAVRP